MAKFSSFLGRFLLALGCIAAIAFNSPQLRFGIRGFFIGGALAALGLWLLAGPEIRAFFGRLPGASGRSPARMDPLLPVRILKLARERRGILTISEAAIGLNLPLEQAEEGLRACVRAGNAMEDYSVSQGYGYFRFPEYLKPDDPRLPE